MIDEVVLFGFGVVTFIVGLGIGLWLSKPENDNEPEQYRVLYHYPSEVEIEEIIEEQEHGASLVENPVEEPELPAEKKIPEVPEEHKEPEEIPYEPEYTREEFVGADGELKYTYIEYPLKVMPNESFQLRFGWKSEHEENIEFQGSVQRLKFYKPVRDVWKGLLFKDEGYPNGDIGNRAFSCKKGITKDTEWKLILGVWDGEHYIDEHVITVTTKIGK